MVWGSFGKTVISLSFIKGFKRTIHQMKGYMFSLSYSVNVYAITFISQKISIKTRFLHFYFLNRDF